MNILFMDPHLIAAIKPPGILSQKDEKNRENMVSLLEKETGAAVFPVHRLDRETGGVMVFARTKEAAAFFSEAIRERKFQKEYLAVLCQAPKESQGTMEDLLFFDRQKNKSFPVKRQRNGVKKAQLTYQVLESIRDLTLVQVFPVTGRTHQIRVQFATRGLPLYGDKKYGGREKELALFCRALSLSHPITGETLSFQAPIPTEYPWSLFSRL